jgi:hypothetical protein
MKWMGIYFLGYVILMCGILAGLWQAGILAHIGPTWTTIGIVIATGLGIMIAVSSGGQKQTIDIERH